MDDGRYTIVQPPFDRRFAMDAFAALPPSHPMVALVELDVTTVERRIAELQGGGKQVSFFAFLVHAIAATIAEHPELNLVCHGRRLVRFDDVDVSVPVEVETQDGCFPREVVLRRAHTKSAFEIYADITAARASYGETGDLGGEDHRNRKLVRLLGWLPRFVRIALMRRVMRNAFTIKRSAGTTLVTSVGKFAAIPGFGFALGTGPRAAAFAIGSVVDKPWIHAGTIVVRRILGMAIIVNHDLVDGGPAARFARRLQARIEGAEGLVSPSPVRSSVQEDRPGEGRRGELEALSSFLRSAPSTGA